MAASTTRAPARDRLLAAANQLFYAEGVQHVGIDRVIEQAGVAKASLYNTFGSKDELIKAYLGVRRDANMARITSAVDEATSPRAKLLAVFASQAKSFRQPGYRGCAFAAASAEATAGSGVEQATDAYREWLRGLFHDLAERAGAADPARLAFQLHLVYDGATTSARLDRSAVAGDVVQQIAAQLIDAAIPGVS